MNNIKQKAFYLLLTLYLAASPASIAFAANGWEANLNIAVSGAENRLLFGEQTDATAGLDGQYDVPPMLGGNMAAYFTNGGGDLWRDIRPLTQDGNSWKLHIESSIYNRYITLHWDPAMFPETAKVTMNDVKDGIIIDMKNNNLFAYKNAAPKDLEIVVQY
jgi:hypothetical protein